MTSHYFGDANFDKSHLGRGDVGRFRFLAVFGVVVGVGFLDVFGVVVGVGFFDLTLGLFDQSGSSSSSSLSSSSELSYADTGKPRIKSLFQSSPLNDSQLAYS